MASIFTGDYKNDPAFEFGEFYFFYDKLNQQLEKKGVSDDKKISAAISNAESFFNKFTLAKNNLKKPNVNVKDTIANCKDLAKSISVPDEYTLISFLTKDKEARRLVEFGERLGGHCAMNKLSSSQIRNVFGEVKKLEMTLALKGEKDKDGKDIEIDALSVRKLMLLIPRLAYAAQRQGGTMNELRDALTMAIKHIKTVGDFNRFVQYFEAILAYHKAYGGK
ncbi:MAG: type III-A CRISPR-associated protein Csm2 [Methylococcales bacterium]|nr:type III-A CRISPR-associated protein Csm2 [Methylococcales bacterium]MDD5630932.1 type III-A CRISPR-associated protein Csm2 [Methylococcales bacterium]